jgi:transcription initiation factor TFIIB
MSRDLQRAQSRANQQAGGPNQKSSSAQLQAAFGRINDMCDAMQLPRTISDRAQHAYMIGDQKRVSRGKNDDALIAAAIIFATRSAGAERTFREVCKVAKVTKSELGRVFTLLRGAVQGSGLDAPMGHSSANQSADGLLTRFVNYLDLGNAIYNASKHIAVEGVAKSAIDGRSPLSIAAGVLYFTVILFEKPTTPREIADVAGVSESTIKL